MALGDCIRYYMGRQKWQKIVNNWLGLLRRKRYDVGFDGYITISMKCTSNHFHFVQVSHQMINRIENISQLNTVQCIMKVGCHISKFHSPDKNPRAYQSRYFQEQKECSWCCRSTDTKYWWIYCDSSYAQRNDKKSSEIYVDVTGLSWFTEYM